MNATEAHAARWAAIDAEREARWAAREAERAASTAATAARFRREDHRFLLAQLLFGLLGAGVAGWIGWTVPMYELTSIAVGALCALLGILVGMVIGSWWNRRVEAR